MTNYKFLVPMLVGLATLNVVSFIAVADDNASPKAIPQTRPEMKAALEKLKQREPRLPLPPVTAEEQANSAGSSSLGIVNNGRMRNLYLPAELRGFGGSRQKDPLMKLDQTLAVELFWIASRVNNCHYCLGHQEVKLKSAGVEEATLAALDCEWKRFTPREQAAFALARRLTESPHALNESEFTEAQQYFSQTEVLEIVYYVARYNATNRWTDSLGIPQEDHRELNTETPSEFEKKTSVVAVKSIPDRGPLPSRAETIEALRDCVSRTARIELVDEVTAAKILENSTSGTDLPNWKRLLSNFPVTGVSAIETYVKSQSVGAIPPKLKAQIAWIAARHDRATYALGHAAHRLATLGYQPDEMFALENGQGLSAGEQAALAFTAKLTSQPQAITDQDIASLRKHFTNSETAEIVHLVTQAAFFDRLTEGMRLPLEESVAVKF